MQVAFKYNNGRVVHMERVYADILQRIKHGAVQEALATASETDDVVLLTSNDGEPDARVQAHQQTKPTPRATVTNNGNGRQRGRQGQGNSRTRGK